jgi:hypothetical protein
MERMMLKFYSLVLVGLLLITSAACGLAGREPKTYPDEVAWPAAVEILHAGEVEAVYQLHSLEVTLVLKDGREVKTIEPRIDEIFVEIEECGPVCAGIIMATE